MVIYAFLSMYRYQQKSVNLPKNKQIENKDIVYIWNNFLLYTNKYLLLYMFINEAGIMYRYFLYFIKMYQISMEKNS